MIRAKGLLSFLILSAAAIMLLFQNCTAQHGEGSSNYFSVLGSGKCDPIIIEGFGDYHAALSRQDLCVSCHVTGGVGNGAFADQDISIALPAFLTKGESLVYDFATNPLHKSGYTGPQNAAILDGPRQKFQSSESEYSKCVQDEGSSGGGGGSTGFPNPTIKTATQPIPANATNPQVIQFDLGNMDKAANNVAGARFEITVQSFTTSLGTVGYDFSLPRIIAGPTTVYVKNFVLHLNGQAVPNPAGSTFQNVDRYVAANTNRALYSSGGMRVVYNVANANTLAIAFEKIELAPAISFTPATYTNLTAGANQNGTIRVFTLRCAGCHTGAAPTGGFTITATDYSALYLNGMFKPFDLNSRLWKTVENDSMPPGAPLPAAEKEFIRGWILDGAPR